MRIPHAQVDYILFLCFFSYHLHLNSWIAIFQYHKRFLFAFIWLSRQILVSFSYSDRCFFWCHHFPGSYWPSGVNLISVFLISYFPLRIFDFGILKLLSCKSTFSAKFIFIPYKSWSFLATFIFIFLITQIQTSVGDLTWRTQSANCRKDPSLSDQYHFQKDPPSISLPYHLETSLIFTL